MVEGYSSSINLTENLGLVSTEAFHQNVPLQNFKK